MVYPLRETHALQGHPCLKKLSFLLPGGKKKLPVGRSGIFCFSSSFIFYKLECTWGEVKKKNKNENMKKKKFQLALFSPLGRWTGNNFLFKGGPMLKV